LKILSTTLAALRATRRVEDRTSNRRQRKLATAENRPAPGNEAPARWCGHGAVQTLDRPRL